VLFEKCYGDQLLSRNKMITSMLKQKVMKLRKHQLLDLQQSLLGLLQEKQIKMKRWPQNKGNQKGRQGQSGAATRSQSPSSKTDMSMIDKEILFSKSRKENMAPSVGIAST
jgi:hypothetical protein